MYTCIHNSLINLPGFCVLQDEETLHIIENSTLYVTIKPRPVLSVKESISLSRHVPVIGQ